MLECLVLTIVNNIQNINYFSSQHNALCLTGVMITVQLVLSLASLLCDSIHIVQLVLSLASLLCDSIHIVQLVLSLASLLCDSIHIVQLL